ncbi:MAG: hypothetical protein U0175_27225 [Caldilineaceae bacterium]
MSALAERDRQIEMMVAGYSWDLIGWEIHALGEKLQTMLHHPAAGLSEEQQAKLVEDYLDRAQQIGQSEQEIDRVLSESNNDPDSSERSRIEQLQAKIYQLRQEQQRVRVTVEAVIEQQISWAIAYAGVEWQGTVLPPVKFTFTEPPKKLIVSPRDQITTIYGQMIDASMPLDQVERVEAQIKSNEDLSGYITPIGGLGAYPTMVVDRASLYWILSTVAHEWTHNYLSFFPLGFNYGVTADNITLNETTAEISGDELGRIALLRFYPDRINRDVYPDLPQKDEQPSVPPDAFDFRKEMQETREVVDLLLRFGRVADAEGYMEARRILFVENGYPIRVLNQAYFAFHGSYGTSAAVSSGDPITPKMFELRELTGSLDAFLKTIRTITTLEALQKAVEQYSP